jgi:hypothetical protein
MGDKTQLATVALAAEYKSIVAVWLGTTTGMLIADAIGIGVGIVLGKKIPERLIKWVAALIFIFFGLSGLYELLPAAFLYPVLILSGLGLAGFLAYEFLWGKKRFPASPAPVCEPGEDRGLPSAEARKSGQSAGNPWKP